jgi:hypothetical protein
MKALVAMTMAVLFAACSLGGGGGSGTEGDTETEGMGDTPASVTAAPASAPTGLAAYADSATSVVITWTALSDAAGYKVYQAAATTGPYTAAGSPKGTKYTVKGLSADTIYFYKVAGVNKYGEGPQSSYVSAEIKTLPAPTGLHVEALSDSSLELSWNPVAGAVSYAVYRSGAQVTTTTETSYVHTGLSPYTQYSYTIATVTNVGTGVKSASVSEYTQPIPLQEGVWKNLSYFARGYSYYSFPVTGGTYYIRWNDTSDGDGSKTGNCRVSAYLKSTNAMTILETSYFSDIDKGYTIPQEINVPSPAYVILKVTNGDDCAIQYYR